jgi:phosphoribosylamine--glycine ligase
MRVLVVGSGAREHALAWKLQLSPELTSLHAAPGNPGMAGLATLHDVAVTDLEALTELAQRIEADLVVIGPEVPLVAGLTDRLAAAGIPAFGPTMAAAELEGSKAFAKHLMAEIGVPTARYSVCDTMAAVEAAVAESDGQVVIKADGLAAGKGVVVCSTAAEANEAARACLVGGRFGGAGTRVVVEERMAGPELSVLALCDGEHVLPLAPARDFKRIYDQDEGPNTGGMGCISPVPDLDTGLLDHILDTIHRPVVYEMARRGKPFRGCLYAGLMLTAEGPRVIEFNTRWGDPETQVIVPRLEGDLLPALYASATGSLAGTTLTASGDACITIVIASHGYPDAPEAGAVIEGIDDAEALDGVHVFHAGTAVRDGKLVAAGGRVLNVTAVAPTLEAARDQAYAAVDLITMAGSHHRTDIGAEAVAMEREHV